MIVIWRRILDFIVGLFLGRRFIVMSAIRYFISNRTALRELLNRKKAIADFGADAGFIKNLMKDPAAFDNIIQTIAANPQALRTLLMHQDTVKRMPAQAEFIATIAANDKILKRIVASPEFVAGLTAVGEDADRTVLARLMQTPAVFEDIAASFERNPEALSRLLRLPGAVNRMAGQAEFLGNLAADPKVARRLASDPKFQAGLAGEDPADRTTPLARLLKSSQVFEGLTAFLSRNPEALSRLLRDPAVTEKLAAQDEFLGALLSHPKAVERIVSDDRLARALVHQPEKDAKADLPVARLVRDSSVFDAISAIIARNPEAMATLLRQPRALAGLPAQAEFLDNLAGSGLLLQRLFANPRLAETLARPPANGNDPIVSLLSTPSTFARVARIVTDEPFVETLLGNAELMARLTQRDAFTDYACGDVRLIGRLGARPAFVRGLVGRLDDNPVVDAFAAHTPFVVAALTRAMPRLITPPVELAARIGQFIDLLIDRRLGALGTETSLRLLERHPDLFRRSLAEPRMRDVVTEAALGHGFTDLFTAVLVRAESGGDAGARALAALRQAFAAPAFQRHLAADAEFRSGLMRLVLATLRDVGADPVTGLVAPLAAEVSRDPAALAACVVDITDADARARFLRAAETGRRLAEAAVWLDPAALAEGRAFLARPGADIDFARAFAALAPGGTLRLRAGTLRLAGEAGADALFRELFLDETLHFDEGPAPRIIDGACGSGLSLGYFKALHPDATIIAFEKDMALLDAARANITRLRLKGIDLRAGVIADRAGPRRTLSGGAATGHALGELLDSPVDLLRLEAETGGFDALVGLGDRIRAIRLLHCAFRGDDMRAQARLTDLLTHLVGNGFEFRIRSDSGCDADEARRPFDRLGRPVTYTIVARNRRPE